MILYLLLQEAFLAAAVPINNGLSCPIEECKGLLREHTCTLHNYLVAEESHFLILQPRLNVHIA